MKRRGGGDRPSRGLDIGHIKHQRFALPGPRANGASRYLNFRFGTRRDGYVGARLNQCLRRREPDAPPSPSD